MIQKGLVYLLMEIGNKYVKMADHIRVEPPSDDGEAWSMEVKMADRVVTVDWNPDDGFKVGDWKSKSYDETFAHVDDLIKKLIS